MAAGKKKQLTEKEVEKRVKDLSGWKIGAKHASLSKTFTFPTYVSGLAFAAKVTVHAEVLEHHPDMLLSYGSVKVTLTTHDAGGLTKNDFELAKRIDGLRV